MDSGVWVDIALVVVFVLVGGVFAATELALVSLRETQLARMEEESSRGVTVAALARDPNRFLSAVQIGVTVAGFFSAAFGASQLAPQFAPAVEAVGVPEGAAGTVSLVATTLVVSYLSLVLGELVPKRLALQKSAGIALAAAPPLGRFATLMTPVIWLLSVSTDALVRLLGGDPSATGEEMTDEELRDLVSGHGSLPDHERQIVLDLFAAADASVKEAMTPRHDVTFLAADQPLEETVAEVRSYPHSRYPVTGRDVDDVIGFLHVRDLIDAVDVDGRTVRDVMREIVALPSTNKVLPSMTQLREQGVHIAVVIDEYGGTDGIVTLEDLVEELVGEIRDEYDDEQPPRPVDGDVVVEGGLTIEDLAERTGVTLPDGQYETVGGYVVAQLGRLAEAGDTVVVGEHRLQVLAVEHRRVEQVRVVAAHVEDGRSGRITDGPTDQPTDEGGHGGSHAAPSGPSAPATDTGRVEGRRS